MLRVGLALAALLAAATAGPPPAATVGRLAEPKQIGSFAPAPAPQTLLENVTVAGFQTKVIEAVNQSGLAAYVAVVYFHLPGCQPCHETLPALKQARIRVEESARTRDVVLIRPIRIFVLDCSQTEAAEVCRRFAPSFPAILGFRQGRISTFNRPREPEVIAWWMARIARPSFFLLESAEIWKNTHLQRIPSFLLVLPDGTHQESASIWEELAVDNLEQMNFYLALHAQGVWDFLPSGPLTVHVSGHEDLGLDTLPYQWVPDKETMQRWLDIKSSPPVTLLDTWNCWKLLRSDLPVVVLRHSEDEAGVHAVARFRDRVEQELRLPGHVLFAELDVDLPDAQTLARSWFPIMGKNFEDFFPFSWSPPPEIFVFAKSRTSGDAIFWYDPEFPNSETFTLEEVDALIGHSKWFYDNGGISLAMQYLLRFDRFGARSPLHRLIWLFTPFCVVGLLKNIWNIIAYPLRPPVVTGKPSQLEEVVEGGLTSDASGKARKARKGSKKSR